MEQEIKIQNNYTDKPTETKKSPGIWPIVLFIVIVFGGLIALKYIM
jgi:hypothetical protein